MKNALWLGISLCLICGPVSAESAVRAELAEVAGRSLGSINVPTPSAAAAPAAEQNAAAPEQCLNPGEAILLVREVVVRMGGDKLSGIPISTRVGDILSAKKFYKAVAQEVGKRGCAIDRVAHLDRLDDVAWYISDHAVKSPSRTAVPQLGACYYTQTGANHCSVTTGDLCGLKDQAEFHAGKACGI